MKNNADKMGKVAKMRASVEDQCMHCRYRHAMRIAGALRAIRRGGRHGAYASREAWTEADQLRVPGGRHKQVGVIWQTVRHWERDIEDDVTEGGEALRVLRRGCTGQAHLEARGRRDQSKYLSPWRARVANMRER
jgi:hypothetical protein